MIRRIILHTLRVVLMRCTQHWGANYSPAVRNLVLAVAWQLGVMRCQGFKGGFTDPCDLKVLFKLQELRSDNIEIELCDQAWTAWSFSLNGVCSAFAMSDVVYWMCLVFTKLILNASVVEERMTMVVLMMISGVWRPCKQCCRVSHSFKQVTASQTCHGAWKTLSLNKKSGSELEPKWSLISAPMPGKLSL